MTEGLFTPDGQPIEVDPAGAEGAKEFAHAMAGPPGEKAAPPKKAPRDREAVQNAPRKPRGRPPKSERARTQSKPPVSPQSDAERKQGVQGLVQIAAFVPFMIGQRQKPPADIPWKADSIVLASNAEALADACVATAKADDRFARVLDKLCSVGPYGALAGVVVSVGSQLARNHGVAVPGTADPADIVKAAEQPGESVTDAAQVA